MAYIKETLFNSNSNNDSSNSSSNSNIITTDSSPLAKSIGILSVADVTGNATITHSRGKVRYLYEFNIELSVEVQPAREGAEPLAAVVKVEDCINDQLDDIVVSISWTKSPPSG